MVERRDAGHRVPERQMLDEWLDDHRATLLMKCDGLSDAQLRARAVSPSPMSLLGLVRHMADVERHWFRNALGREDATYRYWSDPFPDGDFDLDVAGSTGVEQLRVFSHRGVLVHMIEEYARHNGHADLLRECIDATVGD